MGTLAKILVTSTLAAFSYAAALAQDGDPWGYYATGANKTKFYLHKTRFKRVGDKIVVWTKSVPAGPRPVYENKPLPVYTSSLTQYEVACSAQTLGALSVNFFGKDGSSVASYNNTFAEHSSPAPETVNETLLDTVCGLFGNK